MPDVLRHRSKKGQDAKSRSALVAMKRSPRVTQLVLGKTKHSQLIISLRRFRTATHLRSSKYKQHNKSVNLFGYREVCIALKPKSKVRQDRVKQDWQTTARRLALPSMLIAAGIAGTVYFGFNLKKPVDLSPVHVSAAPIAQPTPAKTPSMSHSAPVSLTINKIQLSASIVPTGLDASGTIKVPDNPWTPGWYDQSPTPGEIGPSVIVGHVDYLTSIAIFWRLREMAPGDTFSVGRADGSTANFAVTQIVEYPQDQFPTQDVYGNIDYAGIRLITCGGTFNTTTHHYSHNTVVYAKLVV
jgi:hypothetical protein